jgi:hypothetical protein
MMGLGMVQKGESFREQRRRKRRWENDYKKKGIGRIGGICGRKP